MEDLILNVSVTTQRGDCYVINVINGLVSIVQCYRFSKTNVISHVDKYVQTKGLTSPHTMSWSIQEIY